MNTSEILNNIKEIKIKYKKENIEFKSFEELILTTLFDTVSSDDKKSLFIGIEKELISILLIIILSIKQYSDNMRNSNNNILDILEKEDKVVYEGDLYLYKSIEERNNKKYISLLGKNKLKTLIPIEKSYLLSSYNGQANRINKVNGNSQRYNITKKFISEIMKIEPTQLTGVIKEGTIIVFEHKEELYDLINSIEINFEEKNYMISELFPFAYYTSEENYEYFKGNIIKENSIIKFVSNINTAIDIVRLDENVKNIVLIGEKTYRDSLETELREISMRDNINKILVVDTWESNFDFSLLINDDEPFSVYAISKDVVLDDVDLYDKSLLNLKSRLQNKNYCLLENLINKEIHIYEVDNSEVLNKHIYSINKDLKTLFDYSDRNIKILDFIKLSYYLCNKLEQSLLPLNKCEENSKNLLYRIDRLKEILVLFQKERVEYKLMNDIIFQIEEIVRFLKDENYKLEIINKKLLNNEKSLVSIKNIDEISKIQDYFRRFRKFNLYVKKLEKKTELFGYRSLISPSFFESKYFNILNTNMVESVKIFIYRREKLRFNTLIRKNNEMLSRVLKNNKLSHNQELELTTIVEHPLIKSNCIVEKYPYTDEEKLNEVEDEVQRVIQDNKIKLFINKDKDIRGITNSTMEVHKIITFEDDNYSFLSNNYQANIIDRRINDIKQKGISELGVGDEMIFTRSKLYGEDDIVKVVIKELLEEENFKNVYGEYYKLNNLWKDCLKKYMNTYDLTEKNISNEFRIYGKPITHLAISNWLNGNIIGPQNPDDISTIADIVKDSELHEKLDEVIIACKQVRKIQVQIRKAIAKIILNSVVNNNETNNDIYEIVNSTISDLDRYAYIGTISSIESIHEELSSQHVNKVIERDE